MAKRATDLPILSSADSNDVLVITDVSANTSKQVTAGGLAAAVAANVPSGGLAANAVNTQAIQNDTVTPGKLKVSSFSLNMKSVENSTDLALSNTMNLASNGIVLNFTVEEACKAFVSVDMAPTSSADFEFRPSIYLNGVKVKELFPSASTSVAGRSSYRGFSWVIDLAAGANAISAGIFVSGAPSAKPGCIKLSAMVLGDVTA